jgi:outer membrane lipopolysaccharide assembly protein LptE/RlpB
LRGEGGASLPPALQTLRVTASGGYPPLVVEVRHALTQRGVTLTEDVSAQVPVLTLEPEKTQAQILAIDTTGKVSAYLLNYSVKFTLTDARGAKLIEPQTVKLQQEYRHDKLQPLATERADELLRTEMRRDVAAQITRRLAAWRPAAAPATP